MENRRVRIALVIAAVVLVIAALVVAIIRVIPERARVEGRIR